MAASIPVLSSDQIRACVRHVVERCGVRPRRALVLHPDYARNDFTHLVVPALHDILATRGLERLDTLNAAATHRRMEPWQLRDKLGLDPDNHRHVGELLNHDYDDPAQLLVAGLILANFVAEKTAGHLRHELAVTVNCRLMDGYD